jgi:hypothetical protein
MSSKFTFSEFGKSWFILPAKYCKQSIKNILYAENFFHALKRVEESKRAQHPFKESKFKVPFKLSNTFHYLTPDFKEDLERCLYKNQELRWIYKRLIHRWRLARLKTVNTEDPATCEIPKMPIVIYDWPTRSKYTFEARSLLRDIGSRLLNVSQWEAINPEPLIPRNMLTNLALSIGQIHFMIDKLISLGLTSWEISAYKTACYSLDDFIRVNNYPLKISALKRVFGKPETLYCMELMLDFIEFEHEENDIQFGNQEAWKWYLRQPDDSYKQSLRKMCYEYYVYNGTSAEKIQAIKTEIAILLRYPPVNVYTKWRQSLRHNVKVYDIVLVGEIVSIIEWGGEDETI